MKSLCLLFNPVTGTLKPQSNGPLYSNKMTGTLAFDGWAVTCGTVVQRGEAWAGCGPVHSPLLAVPNVTAHPSTASVPSSYYSMWHYNCQCRLKGYQARPVSWVSLETYTIYSAVSICYPNAGSHSRSGRPMAWHRFKRILAGPNLPARDISL